MKQARLLGVHGVGVAGDDIYLLHVLRKRMEFPELKPTNREQAATHRTTNILIEDRASGSQLIQELRHENLEGVSGVSPPGDKQMRLAAQTPAMEAGRVHLPLEAPWLEDYLHELTTFPNAKRDDQAPQRIPGQLLHFRSPDFVRW